MVTYAGGVMTGGSAILIKGGMVFDGLGGPAQNMDVLISGDEIIGVEPVIDKPLN